MRSDESLSLSILREVEEEGVRGRSVEITVTAPVIIANYIMNNKRAHLSGIEQRYAMVVTILGDAQLISPEYRIDRSKTRSRPIDVPEVVITAESAAAPAAPEPVEAAPESTPDERPDETGEGRSRRRRGKRGGQRRRREEAESVAEDSAGETGESAQDTSSDGAPDTAESAEGDRKSTGERRTRRRRGGRGRSLRPDDDAVAGTAEAEAAGEVPEQPDQPAPAEAAPTEAADEAGAGETVVETALEPESAVSEPAVSEPVKPDAVEDVAQAPEPVSEPEPDPVPEPVAAAPAEPDPVSPNLCKSVPAQYPAEHQQ